MTIIIHKYIIVERDDDGESDRCEKEIIEILDA